MPYIFGSCIFLNANNTILLNVRFGSFYFHAFVLCFQTISRTKSAEKNISSSSEEWRAMWKRLKTGVMSLFVFLQNISKQLNGFVYMLDFYQYSKIRIPLVYWYRCPFHSRDCVFYRPFDFNNNTFLYCADLLMALLLWLNLINTQFYWYLLHLFLENIVSTFFDFSIVVLSKWFNVNKKSNLCV